jgi:perosamine synthetase
VTTSGTTALFLCLMASNSECVTVPAYGLPAAANAGTLAGVDVHLVDVDSSTMMIGDNMDVECSHESTAFVFVEQNGPARGGVASGCGIDIRDTCQAFIRECYDPMSDYQVLSFSVPKIVTTGQGGTVLSSKENAGHIRRLVDHGGGQWRKTKIHEAIGGNFRMTDMQAALGISQLSRFDSLIAYREEQRKRYETGGIVFSENTCYAYTRSSDADGLIAHLDARGVQAVQYYKPVSHSWPYRTLTSFPGAERVAREVVYLPSGPGITLDEIDHVCQAVKGYA